MSTQTATRTLTDWQRWKICLVILDITVQEWADMAGVIYNKVSRYYKSTERIGRRHEDLDDLLECSWVIVDRKLRKVLE